MFDRTYIRGWIAVFWLVLFVGLWGILQYGLMDQKQLLTDIDKLEENVVQEDWQQAKTQMAQLESHWESQRLYIQIGSGEADVREFTKKLSEAKTLVKNEEDDVMATIGELKDLAKSVAVVFPGP